MKRPRRRPKLERLHRMPVPLRHRRSQQGIQQVWREMALIIHSPRILDGLPPFAAKISHTFWDVDPGRVIDAVVEGDPVFFVAFQLRLDQIDYAMLDAGRTIADRAPIVRARWILDGFKQAAVESLEKLGGSWPAKQINEASPA